MEVKNKSLVLDGSFNLKFLLGILSLGIIATTIYLTKHYFDVLYPVGLAEGSLCDINSFFNCDAATLSKASNIFGVPIALFGLIMGLVFFLGSFHKSLELEGTIYFLAGVNLIGCIGLFIYSLISLGSLCPFCTLYYVLSAVIFFIYFKNSDYRSPSPLILSIFSLIILSSSGVTYAINSSKQDNLKDIANSLIKDYDSYKKLGDPSINSPYYITKSSQKKSPPLKLIIFSDFQCPACRKLSDMMHPVIKKYREKIDILYYFYPLDPNCNPSMKRALHTLACKAAYLASCLPDKFVEVHDEIFNNQNNLSTKWINNYASKENVTKCINAPETKEKVVDLIRQGEEFGSIESLVRCSFGLP